MHPARWVLGLARNGDIAFGPCSSEEVPSHSLVATSTVGLSRVTVASLPLPERGHLRTVTSVSLASSPAKATGLRPDRASSVLIVEDDCDILTALQDLLEFEGYLVDCAQTCSHAFSLIEQNVYDAVLLDLGLPDGDGCSILEKLQVSHPSLPVIVLTASNRDLGPLRVYARLTKPWKRGELCGILHRAISTSSSRR
jgi:CheY-like chemotaxis protein